MEHSRDQKFTEKEQAEAAENRQRQQERYDERMIRALASSVLICHDPKKGTWRAEDYFIVSQQRWITKVEAQQRLERQSNYLNVSVAK